MIEIEIIRAGNTIERQVLRFESAPKVQRVLEAAGWRLGDLNFELSIWGKPATLETQLSDGMRLELTRGLLIDPKRARARRVDSRPRHGWVRRAVREATEHS